jgi:hypothetical protein
MQALIAPTEAGYSLNDIKRAALVYDKVFLLDPGDRDLFPGTAFMMACSPSGPAGQFELIA